MSIEAIERICMKWKITVEMFYVLLLMHYKNRAQLVRYNDVVKKYRDKVLTDTEIQQLIAIKFIIPDGNKANKFLLGENFKSLFVNKTANSNEFWNEYPGFVTTSDKSALPLKNIPFKKFHELYSKLVETSEEHELMMEDLKWANENKFRLMRIDSYLNNKQWEEIRKLREELGSNYDSTVLEKDFDYD